MKITLLLFTCVLLSFNMYGQLEIKDGPKIICPVDNKTYDPNLDRHVEIPEHLEHLMDKSLRSKAQFKSNIVVNYVGFTQEAQDAFQFAVDIWQSLLPSPVTIYIDAQYTDLGNAQVLGSTSSRIARGFRNSPNDTTFFALPLAEKIAGEDLNEPGEGDMSMVFNSVFAWYLGTDGNTPPTLQDFVSVVLHEIGHGLGFFGARGYDTSTGNGFWNYAPRDFTNDQRTAIYNLFAETGDGTPTTDIPTGTVAFGDALTGNDLYFNGPLAVTKLGERPRLYAPATYAGGSTLAHLDEATYPPGNPHTLMSPQQGNGESSFDPGVALDIFADMGWFATVIEHTQAGLPTSDFANDIIIEATIRRDTGLVKNDLYLVYSTDNLNTIDSVLMTVDGNTYTGNIPNPGIESTITYFMRGIEDELGKSVTSPANAPSKFYSHSIRNSQNVASIPFTEDFESGAKNNTDGFISYPIEGNLNLWELGAPGNSLLTSSTPANVWKTSLASDVEERPSLYSAALASPPLDMSTIGSNYSLSFELAMEAGFSNSQLMTSGPIELILEYTTDGETWEKLGANDDARGTNWYNTINDSWVFNDLTAKESTYNVSNLAGNGEVAFRFVFSVDENYFAQGYTDGVLIDNFSLEISEPTAEFIVVQTEEVSYPGTTVSFEYISGGATSYLWDFGDGNSSTEQNPSHTYTSGGSFDVSLTIEHPGGNDQVIQTGAVNIIPNRGSSYTLEEGGNFEVENGDFTVVNISGTGFERGNSTVAGKNGTSSGDFAYVTGINDANYLDESKAYIYTPLFDFSLLGSYELAFNANYTTEDGWDGFILEYTTDFGESWSHLDPTIASDWYDRVAENNSDNPEQVWNMIPIFTGNSQGYTLKTRDISSLAGNENIGFRFHWRSDFAATEIGIAIDDFTISGPDDTEAAVAAFSASEDSGCTGTTITFTNESTGAITDIQWNFGSGADPETASGIGPHMVTYSSAGNYTVSLTAEGLVNGTQVEEKVGLITIGEISDPSITPSDETDNSVLLTAMSGDSYLWFKDGDEISGATDQTLLVSERGTYTVEVTTSGCPNLSSNGYLFEPVLGTDLQNENFVVYPNPITDGKLTLEVKDAKLGDLRVNIVDLSGKNVYSLKDYKSSSSYNRSLEINIDSGYYYVIIELSDKKYISKLLFE